MNHFILRTDHKLLEWLATVSDAHGRRGKWVDMLQDFSFKIIHRPGLRHTNVDALSRNSVGLATDDDDFRGEIQDIGNTQIDALEGEREIRFVQMGKETKWLGVRRKDREFVQHHVCYFGINHWNYASNQQLFVVDVVSEEDQPKEPVPYEARITRGGELMQDNDVRVVMKRRGP
jgi:hypothetical protein